MNKFFHQNFTDIQQQVQTEMESLVGEVLDTSDPLKIVTDIVASQKFAVNHRLNYIVDQLFEVTAEGKYLDRLISPYILRYQAVQFKCLIKVNGDENIPIPINYKFFNDSNEYASHSRKFNS